MVKKGTGKRIGKQWERDVANMFTDVFELSFHRVPGSGAFIGGKNVERIAHLSVEQVLLAKGDIIPPSELPHLIIECKKRKDFKMHMAFTEYKDLNDWIDQTVVDYDACGQIGLWIIVMKFNNRGYFVCYPEVITTKDQAQMMLSKEPNHLRYNYNGKVYIIESFTKEWIEKRKDELFLLCG